MESSNTELILIRITGEDRPGLTSSIMGILARYDVTVLDIGQADIHNTLTLGLLVRAAEEYSGHVMRDLLFKASELGVNIRFYPLDIAPAVAKVDDALRLYELYRAHHVVDIAVRVG